MRASPTVPIGNKIARHTLSMARGQGVHRSPYAGNREAAGLTGYRFEQTAEAPIKIRGALPGTYTNTHTVFWSRREGSIDLMFFQRTGSHRREAEGWTLAHRRDARFSHPARMTKVVHDATVDEDEIGAGAFWMPLGCCAGRAARSASSSSWHVDRGRQGRRRAASNSRPTPDAGRPRTERAHPSAEVSGAGYGRARTHSSDSHPRSTRTRSCTQYLAGEIRLGAAR